jgi:hypothetical protein
MEYNIEKRIIDVALELKSTSEVVGEEMRKFQETNPTQEEMEKRMPEIMKPNQDIATKLFSLLDEYEFINGSSDKVNG